MAFYSEKCFTPYDFFSLLQYYKVGTAIASELSCQVDCSVSFTLIKVHKKIVAAVEKPSVIRF